jgi:hypothetical protein
MSPLNPIGRHLRAGLDAAHRADDVFQRQRAQAEKVNIVGAGGALTAAYEQLRNAAENTEEHLLLQNAIKRSFKQLFVTRDEALVRTSGNELAVELTLAGYVPNDSLTKEQLAAISQLATDFYATYEVLLTRRDIRVDTGTRWVLETLSVLAARVIDAHEFDRAFADFAYTYFDDTIPQSKKKTTDRGAALFAAVHKALLKSDSATIRAALFQRYQIDVRNIEQFIGFHQQIDAMLESDETDRLYHVVDRQGAPLRILRRMSESNRSLGELLDNRDAFLEAYEQQVSKEYAHVVKRVNRAIVRSVIFLIITKVLIGIAIEVPYDLWAHGTVIWMPLIINLFFPPLYMIALRLTLNTPSYANTTALVNRIDKMLYGSQAMTLSRKQLSGRTYGPIFSVMYVLFGLVVFGAVMWLLLMLGFSLVHIAIFFIFISAASFLGFRLSRLIREIEVGQSASNGFTVVRDFIYLPFVVVGQWISDRYAQVNIVAAVLDMVIELPMKTVLRLVRQWGAFIDDRKDHI